MLALQIQELGCVLFEFSFCLVALFRYPRKTLRRALYLDVEFLEPGTLARAGYKSVRVVDQP